MTTALIYDERFLSYSFGAGLLVLPTIPEQDSEEHAATPRMIGRTWQLLSRSGMLHHLARVSPRPASVEELMMQHTADYVARIHAFSAGIGGEAGSITHVPPGGYEVAALAAGGALAAVEEVLAGSAANAYALLRPPGHHALPDFGMGSCVFGNVALAAHLARRRGVARVAIIDWDVHHGNGTQSAFNDDPSVLFISIHQDSLYPVGSGPVDDVGGPEARGFTVNVPLPGATGDAGYLAAFERLVVPILTQFKPELILVSAGQDANIYDPLGRMMLSSNAYRVLTGLLRQVAELVCKGRLVICHEGGYSTVYVPFCTVAIIEELCGTPSGVVDPFIPSIESIPTVTRVQPEATLAIERAIACQTAFWNVH